MERGEDQAGDESAHTRKILEDLAAARDFFLEASLTLQDALDTLDTPVRRQAAEEARQLLARTRQ